MTSTNNILVFSIALEGYSKLFQSCIDSQKEYCSRYGFKYILVDQAPRNLQRAEAAWLKIFLLRSALKCDYNWIAFIDADCEIRKHAPTFIQEFDKYKDKSIFLAPGFSGRINSGVIFLKNTEEAIGYLEKVIKNGDQEVPYEDKALYENGHMIHYGKNHPYVQLIEAVKWNNNFNLDQNSYIQHYSGGILRKQYLTSSGISKRSPSFLLKIRDRIKTIFYSGKTPVTMSQMQLLLPFYHKKYPEINCKNS